MNNNAKEYQLQGIDLMGGGNYQKAKEAFLKALNEEKNVELYMDLGNACASIGEYKEALEAFSSALMLEPNDGKILFSIGSVYLLQGNKKKTLEFYNKAESNGFKETILYTNFAKIYKELGDLQLELRNYTKAIESNPLRGDLYIYKINLYLEQRRFQEALNTLEDLRNIVPDAFEGYDLAAKIYMGLNEKEKAIEVLEEGIKKFPNDLNLLNSKVSLYVSMKDVKNAEETLKELKRRATTEVIKRTILMQEVSILALKEDADAIITKLEEVLELEDDCDEVARFMLMMNYMVKENYDKALEMANVLDEQMTDSHYALSGIFYKGDILKKLGKNDEAVMQFRKASKYFRKLSLERKTSYECYLYRALCHKELGEYEKALEMADFIEGIQPERADAYIVKADVYKAMGNEVKSNEQFEIAKEKNPRLVRKED